LRRRQFIQLGAGFALSVLAGQSAFARARDRIIIIGGGIVGASMAYYFSRRGAQVTLLEKTRPAAGATGKSFAWINANFSKQPRHYHLFSRLGVQAFRNLQQEVGVELGAQWTGTVEWYANPERADELRRMVHQQQEWGYPIRLIGDQDFARLEPRVTPGKTLTSAFSELEGSVDAAEATAVLLRRAQAAGASVVYPCEVLGIKVQSGRGALLKTTQGEFHGDTAILACGVDTPKLASLVGAQAPLVRSPGIVVRTAPQPKLVQRVLVTEDSHFRQQADGRVVLGDDYGPPATEVHKQLDSELQDFPDPSFAELHGQRIRTQAARYLPPLAKARIDKVSLCWRPLPKDGFPIVGFASRAPELYLVVTHSGVTLGPLLGELTALKLLDGVKVDLLEPYRPARFGS
jgi:glycine/D-amino acid oxidase-like deaminating enzyme